MAKSREQYIAENTDDYEGDLYAFALVDRHTVERLQRDGDITLPYKDLDKIKDERWNTKLFTSRLLQGILNGDPIPNIAARLLDVVGYNESAAMRNARTMTTACENRGRQDSYEELADNGVVQKKVWIATPDDRTRASHLEIDGEEVDIDAEFSNGLKYPADPDGDESEVYNCRCSMRDMIIGFRAKDGHIEYVDYGRDKTTHFTQIRQEQERREKITQTKSADTEGPMRGVPKIVGDKVGVAPLPTLVLLFLGYKFWSVFGMVVAVPIAMIFISLYQEGVFDNFFRSIRIIRDGLSSFIELPKKEKEEKNE